MKRLLAPLLPNRHRHLRMLAHSRRIVGVMLPLGAGIGLLVAAALQGLGSFEPWVARMGGRFHLALALPAVGLLATTLLLHATGIGEVSLFKDLDLARKDPYQAFPFWTTLGKVAACTLSIGFGGSLGIEGPGKWLGAALGLQYHRLLRAGARRLSHIRHLAVPALVMVQGGAAAALAAVFRAPLSGALMAAEHHGHLSAASLIPCLISAATGYVAFAFWHGHSPLLPQARPYTLHGREIGWALLLGLACGLTALLYRQVQTRLRGWLDPVPLLWRGLVAGIGLVLLALPGHLIYKGLPVTLGGGLELVRHLLEAQDPIPLQVAAFLALKLVATALSFAGGGVGGLWLPSIAMGAALGAIFDGLLGLGQPGYMTLVGAAALAGATHQTLLVPCVFLAETTGQAALVVPALVGTVVSYVAARERD